MAEKIKIFIAEDDPLMMRMYERIFRLSGYDIEMASDGENALAKLRKIEDISSLVVLLDIMMPRLSGFEVLRAVKADEKLKNLRVIMLTNLAGKEDAEKALGMGAMSYLIKSEYSPKEVVEKVKEIIATPAEGGGPPAPTAVVG